MVCIMHLQLQHCNSQKLNIPTQIAQNSAIAAEEARRDGSSMKTIAVLTLLFLPATTIAVTDL